ERERLNRLLPQSDRREARERGQHAERRLAPTEAVDDERPERDRPGPRQLVEEAREPPDQVVEEVRESVEDAEGEIRMRDVAVVAEPRLEAIEVGRERIPGDRGGPVRLVLPAEEPDQHPGDDEHRRATLPAPPRRRQRLRDALG